MKFLTNKGMYSMRGSQLISKRCTSTCLKRKKTLVLDQLRSLTEHIEVKVEAFEELKEVRLGKSEGIVIKLGSTLELRQ